MNKIIFIKHCILLVRFILNFQNFYYEYLCHIDGHVYLFL